MSHQIYTTQALILASRDFGESNRWYYLLTPDYGLIIARAQGVRELKSKLRGHLKLFELAQISLVRGREYWRLIGTEKVASQAKTFSVPRKQSPEHEKSLGLLRSSGAASLAAQARVANLLRRLLPEAAADPALFEVVKKGFADLPGGEVKLVWKILRQLGYIARPEIGDSSEKVLIQEINHALSHSHL